MRSLTSRPRTSLIRGAVAASFHTKNMIVLVLASICIGIGTAFYLRPEDWSVLRTILLGAFGGAGTGFVLVASRAIGAFDVTDNSDDRQ